MSGLEEGDVLGFTYQDLFYIFTDHLCGEVNKVALDKELYWGRSHFFALGAARLRFFPRVFFLEKHYNVEVTVSSLDLMPWRLP